MWEDEGRLVVAVFKRESVSTYRRFWKVIVEKISFES